MSIFKRYKRNDDFIVKGRRMELGVGENGKPEYFYIARAHESNPAFQTELQNELQRHRAQLEAAGDAADKLRSDIVLKVFCMTCIKGWENIVGDNGELLEYTAENLIKIHETPELAEALFKFSATSSNYVGTFSEDEALKQ